MQTPLGLFLFSALLSTGASLQCETCMDANTTCAGEPVNCTADQDTCIVGLLKVTLYDGKTIPTIMKSCQSSAVCKDNPFYFHFGNGMSALGNITCCTGEDCASVSPQLPPEVIQTNGAKCPACFGLNETCHEEEIDCVGPETFCFDMDHQHLTIAGNHTNITVKGCITEAYCKIAQHVQLNITDFQLEGEITCTPAKRVAPTPAGQHDPTTAGASGKGSLLALSGILLLKFLF